MSMQQAIEKKMAAAFAPEHLEVINESHLHAGHKHGGADDHGSFDGSGETHFRVRVIAKAFDGLSRVARHRAINELLAEELAASVHALAIEVTAPGEPTRR